MKSERLFKSSKNGDEPSSLQVSLSLATHISWRHVAMLWVQWENRNLPWLSITQRNFRWANTSADIVLGFTPILSCGRVCTPPFTILKHHTSLVWPSIRKLILIWKKNMYLFLFFFQMITAGIVSFFFKFVNLKNKLPPNGNSHNGTWWILGGWGVVNFKIYCRV